MWPAPTTVLDPMRTLVFCLSIAALPACVTAARAQEPDTIDVTGVVGDASTGRPIVGALVELPDLKRRTVTLEGGRFLLFDLPPGPHELRVSMLGYADWEQTTPMEHLDLLRVGLLPKPMALENIKVTVGRLERQRDAAPWTVEAVEREELMWSPYGDVATALRGGLLTANTTIQTVSCSAGGSMLQTGRVLSAAGDPLELCVKRRGAVIRPTIVIDNVEADFILLSTYSPAELYSIEFVSNGQCIRVYTNQFLESGGTPLSMRVACGFF